MPLRLRGCRNWPPIGPAIWESNRSEMRPDAAYQLRVVRVVRESRFPEHDAASPPTFADLVRSRKDWISAELRSWCRRARRSDLLLAEQEWFDIAGKADAAKTLWAWAWSRFPDLVHEDLGIDESAEVTVSLSDGRSVCGYPDARRSVQGRLVLYGESPEGVRGEFGPYSIDDVAGVSRAVNGA